MPSLVWLSLLHSTSVVTTAAKQALTIPAPSLATLALPVRNKTWAAGGVAESGTRGGQPAHRQVGRSFSLTILPPGPIKRQTFRHVAENAGRQWRGWGVPWHRELNGGPLSASESESVFRLVPKQT